MHFIFISLTETSCRVDKIPRKGWIERQHHRKVSIGDYVENFGEINIRCVKNFAFDEPQTKTISCINGQWSIEMPDCYATCSHKNITSISIRPVKCTRNDKKVDCGKPAAQGTIAHIQCRDGYRRSGPKDQVITCGMYGKWSPEPRKCAAICGELPKPKKNKRPESSRAVIPWHVGIYIAAGDTFELQCGGTIVSERAIISAAHCFWDAAKQRLQHFSMFRVVAGYDITDFAAIEDPKARQMAKVQLFEVQKIVTAGTVTDHYDSDIAMLLLTSNIKYKPHIAPACLPIGLSDEHPVGYVGTMAGWRLYNQGEQSVASNMQTIQLSVVAKEQCLASTSMAFRPYATENYKYCTVYSTAATRICHGSFGGGLVFPHDENGTQKFYLRGVASRGPSIDGICDSDIYALFVNNVFFTEYFANNGGGWQFSRVLLRL